MRCDEIMNRDTKCVSPEDTVQSAARVMRDEDIGFLPVCDDQKRVIGVVTDRDITIRAVADGRFDLRVRDCLSEDVLSCAPDEDVMAAEDRMQRAQVSRIVCCDAGGRLLGVISLADVARIEPSRVVADLLSRITTRHAIAA